MKKGKYITANRRRQRGFTIMELMITVTLVSITAALAVPAMGVYIKNSRLTGASQELLRTLQTARSEATKRQQRVVVCASANPTAGNAAACATSGLTGWFSFADVNANGAHATDGSEEVIGAYTIDASEVNLRGNGTVTYLTTGFTNPGGASAIVVCDSRGNVDSGGGTAGNSMARGLDISPTGRPRITRSITEISGLLTEIGAGTTCP